MMKMRRLCSWLLVFLGTVLFCHGFSTRPLSRSTRLLLQKAAHQRHDSVRLPLRLWMTAAGDDDNNDKEEAPAAAMDNTTIPTSLGASKTKKKPKRTQSTVAAVASTKDSASSSPSFQLTKTSSGSSGSSSSPSDKNKKSNRWDSFDYYQHWYPVTWACDVLPDSPTQVTLLDVDYVICYDSKRQQWTALQDRCPHKAAALSEGRLTESGFLQCAYHGWSFNGTNGDCIQIPQSISEPTEGENTAPKYPPRACAKAIPIVEHQTMIWLWPGPTPPTKDPPSIPEMDLEGWKVTRVVRDFPMVDWSLLLSNILDPDHGAFAHQNLAFDYYTASAQHPQTVSENFEDGGWELRASVSAVDKVLAVDQATRQLRGLKTKSKTVAEDLRAGEDMSQLQATSHFMAPTTVSLCRRDADGNTKFITAFWVCPTGTGRSRFLSAAVGTLPFTVPRWLLQLNLNRFLDQDTVLVASQQPPILTAEAQGVEKPRASLFAYGSATDKTVRLIDNFWDATLHKAPNRALTLQQLYRSGQLQHTAPRSVVLDRQVQHTDICPDSQGFVRNCKRITRVSLAMTFAWLVKVLWQRTLSRKSLLLPMATLLVAWVADQLRNQFTFVKTEASRNKDLRQIPVKAWLDP